MMIEKKCLKNSDGIFNMSQGFPTIKQAASFGKNNKNSMLTTPKNLAFQLIRAHLVRKHIESNNRSNTPLKTVPLTHFKSLNSLTPIGKDSKCRDYKPNKFDKKKLDKYEMRDQLKRSKRYRGSNDSLVAIVPSNEDRFEARQRNIENYNMYVCEKNANKRSSIDSDELSILGKMNINTREQLAYSKVDLNNYENAMTRSIDNYEDYSRNLNSNVSREGMIFQQFVENDFENDLHIHHSKRLILPSITRRYENMDFSIDNSSSFNTNYRYTGLNQKALKDSYAKNLSVKENSNPKYLPGIK